MCNKFLMLAILVVSLNPVGSVYAEDAASAAARVERHLALYLANGQLSARQANGFRQRFNIMLKQEAKDKGRLAQQLTALDEEINAQRMSGKKIANARIFGWW